MSEILPLADHEITVKFSFVERIRRISQFIGAESTAKMEQAYLDGRMIYDEYDRLTTEIASDEQKLHDLQARILNNRQYRQTLELRLEVAAQAEAQMEGFIAGFDTYVSNAQGASSTDQVLDEKDLETRQIQRVEVLEQRAIPPFPKVKPTVMQSESFFGNFNNVHTQRPIGKVALVQGIAAPLLGGHRH